MSTVITVLGIILGSSVIGTLLNRLFAVQDKKSDKQGEILKEIKDLRQDLDDHVRADEEYKANQCRTRILRFSDELRRGVQHSEESFNNVLDDIDFYLAYCAKNKNSYVNSKADAAIRNVRDVHDRCIRGELEYL